MKPDTKNRLDRLLFMQRLKYGLTIGAIVIALVVAVSFGMYEEEQHIDKVTSTHAVLGTVVKAVRGQTRRSGFYLTVRLDDGTSVKTVSRSAKIPFEGERVSLQEIDHKSGSKRYILNKLLEK